MEIRRTPSTRTCRYVTFALALWYSVSTAQIHIKHDNPPESTTIYVDPAFYPVDGVATSGYGWRNGRIHHGLDIGYCNRKPVYSTWNGVVRYAKRGYNGGYGYLVIVEHELGLETYYAHLREILVSEGDTVTPLIPLGLVGTTGNSLGPHLHYECRFFGLSLDPTNLFGKSKLTLKHNGHNYLLYD